VAGSILLLFFLNSGQGGELLKIASQKTHGVVAQLVLVLIPLVYFALSLLLGLFFLLLKRRSKTGVMDPVFISHFFIIVLISALVPLILVSYFPVTLFQWMLGVFLLLIFAILGWQIFKQIRAPESSTKKIGQTVTAALAILLFIAIFIGWLVVKNMTYAEKLGTIGILLVALSIWVGFFILVCGLIPSTFGARPKYLLGLIFVVFIFIVGKPEQMQFESIVDRALRMHEEGDRANTWWAVGKLDSLTENQRRWYDPDKRPLYSIHILNWLRELAEREENSHGPIDTYLVSAEGGGIRAAVWTASILSTLELESKGKFSRHTMAYSGVSGGSLGMAVFLACNDFVKKLDQFSSPIECTSKALSKDFLAAGVARLLLVEPLRSVPILAKFFSARDRAFEELIEKSVELPESENRLVGPISAITRTSFKQPLLVGIGAPVPTMPQELQLLQGLPIVPPPIAPGSIAIFNATDAWTGQRVLFSNVSGLTKSHQIFGQSYQADGVPLLALKSAGVPVSMAVHASSRFPLFSPPGLLADVALVDGGYRENTGAQELLPLLEDIRRLQREFPRVSLEAVEVADEPKASSLASQRKVRSLLDRLSVRVVAITNNTYSATPPDSSRVSVRKNPNENAKLVEITAPLQAILAAREAMSVEAIAKIRSFVERRVELGFEDCTTVPTRLSRGDVDARTLKTQSGKFMLVSACTNRPLRDQFHEIALASYVSDGLPILGWTLAKDTFDQLSNEYPNLATRKFIDTQKPLWWHHIQKFICEDTVTRNGGFSINNSGKVVCDEKLLLETQRN
jgi:hypothetical protein